MDRWDGIGLVGVVLVAVGLWLWWPPASLVAAGGMLVLFALLGSYGNSGKRSGSAE